jgi:GntR family transcriptional regulator
MSAARARPNCCLFRYMLTLSRQESIRNGRAFVNLIHQSSGNAPGSGADVVPLYHRIYVVLRQKILDGSFPLDVSMPSEDELGASFKVSRVTIRKAMERLEREGLVHRQRGRGTFPQVPVSKGRSSQNKVFRHEVSLAEKTQVQVLDYGLVNLPAALESSFGAEAGTKVLRVVRVRRDSSSPISYSVCYLPAELAKVVSRRSVGSLPISASLTKSGITLKRYFEQFTAVLADTEVARKIDVDVGSALISLTRRIEDEEGRTVEWLQVLYRPDRYVYRVEYSSEELGSEKPWRAMFSDHKK